MSPTSYQTAPPRTKIITARCRGVKRVCSLSREFSRADLHRKANCEVNCEPTGRRTEIETQMRRAAPRLEPGRAARRHSLFLSRSAANLLAFASVDNFCRIDRFPVNLLFENFPVFPNQEINAPRRFIFVHVDSIFARHVSAPIAQQRE